jgi:hypothetical protein
MGFASMTEAKKKIQNIEENRPKDRKISSDSFSSLLPPDNMLAKSARPHAVLRNSVGH